MKKKILIVIGVLSLFLFLFPESKVSASVNNKTQNLGGINYAVLEPLGL